MKKHLTFFISGIITAVIMAMLAYFIPDEAQAKGTLVSGLIVAITIIAIPIYSIDKWSLLTRSIVHFLVMITTVLPLLLWSHWFSPTIAIGVFLLFGAAGWTIGYVANRHTR